MASSMHYLEVFLIGNVSTISNTFDVRKRKITKSVWDTFPSNPMSIFHPNFIYDCKKNISETPRYFYDYFAFMTVSVNL